MVEQYPDASDLSLQISNIIDDLGVFAQWLIGKEKSKELFKKSQNLTELTHEVSSMRVKQSAQNHGRNRSKQTGQTSSKATVVKSLQKLE